MARLTLISHHLCPYVQRAAIALSEKAVPFERQYVDLASKPDWFREFSPLGKVPLLLVGEPSKHPVVLFESVPIVEYLEDITETKLHPADPLQRARHRAWIEFGSAILSAIARFYSASDNADFIQEAAGMEKNFARLEIELGKNEEGRWFSGDTFSLVDAVYAPVFRYFDAFERIGSFHMLDNKPQIAAWRRNLSQRPSVRNAVNTDFPERLDAFLLARNGVLSMQQAA